MKVIAKKERVLSFALSLMILFSSPLIAQNSEEGASAVKKMTADEVEINLVLQEMFWRVKANDNSAFYEQEFSYLRKTMTLDFYLTGRRFINIPEPNSDSITVLTLDSAVVKGDTALAHLTLTVGGGDDAEPHYKKSTQRLYREKDRWIKPLSTNPHDNDKFYRRIEEYERDANREAGD